MNARTVRKLRAIAEARWELRKWAAIADPERAWKFRVDIAEITITGELPRVNREGY